MFGLGSDLETADTAQCAALLHDIGRFQQFASFGTYDDRISINHAALSVVVIDQLGLVDKHSCQKRDIIRLSVRLHNSEVIPSSMRDDELFMVRLLRDADKLDIWRVVLDMDKDSPIDENYSAEIFELVSRFEHVPYACARTKADMRLFRLSWIFDVYFPPSLKVILARGYLESMFSKLPQTQKFAELKKTITEDTHRRAS